jgi:DNA-binding transcriptional LysR family regulator
VAIELKHLRYVEAAARCGSFRKAAESLSLKQSNLSRRVRRLEEQLGIALFERTNGGVRPTSAGRDFINSVRRILAELQIVVDGAKAVGRGEAGYLTIGFYTSLSAGNLRSTLFDYSRLFPKVQISAVEGPRSFLCTGLRNGTIDIAIVTGEPAAEEGRSMALWSERILIALPDAHRLAAKDVLTWADLKRERFVLSTRDPGPEIEAILIAKLVTPGESLDIDHHDVNAESLKSLVSAGRGITVVCESCMGSVPPGLVFRETRDGNGSTRVGFCAYWMPGNENPALRNFVRLLEERCPPLGLSTIEPRSPPGMKPDPST